MNHPAATAQRLAPADKTAPAHKSPDNPPASAATAPASRQDHAGEAVTGRTPQARPGGSAAGKRPGAPGYLQARLAV
ncbi:hypothetical protein, partial [Thauera aminoaromatica]